MLEYSISQTVGFVKAIQRAKAVRDIRMLNLLIVGTRGSNDQIKELAGSITSACE